MFQNYSQTYASQITSVVGLVIALLATKGITILPQDAEFVAGLIVNVVGIIWTLTHRHSQGDVTALGFRK